MKLTKHVFAILILGIITVWSAYFFFPEEKLYLITCDVGQGDAILAVYGEIEILIDGGPDKKVLDCLSRHIPFWDKEIEAVILTHPQTDHFEGLIGVFEAYKVDLFVANSLDSSTQDYEVLQNLVGGGGTRVVDPKTGMSIRLGLIHLDIVWPSEEFIDKETSLVSSQKLGARTSKRDPNDFSVVAILSLGEFDALLTGDIGPEEIPNVLATGRVRDVDYIKIPHHGSKNGITQDLLNSAKPEVAVISVGKNNGYGHPNKEILDMLKNAKVPYFRTDEMGDVEVITDGRSFLVN